MKDYKYIYICRLVYSSGVYQTQVIDWLDLYVKYGISFRLIHQFMINPKRISYHLQQTQALRKAYRGKISFEYLFHDFLYFNMLNPIILLFYTLGDILSAKKVVIFSRAPIENDIKFLRRLFGKKIIYYYDLRAATVDEEILRMKSRKSFSKSHYSLIAKKAFSEYNRQLLADKIFVVSKSLQKYFIENYKSNPTKFVLYPCLSLQSKYYYDEQIRSSTRLELGYSEEDNVYVYSGGIVNSYHIPAGFLLYFEKVSQKDPHAKLLIMTKETTDKLRYYINEYVSEPSKVIVKEKLSREEILRHLNAADFGLLLRDDNPVNNVASPSKFAEYQLCGLPTIISEAVWDYAKYCRDNNSGYILPNNTLRNLQTEEVEILYKTNYNRNAIASLAKQFLSKENAVKGLTNLIKPL